MHRQRGEDAALLWDERQAEGDDAVRSQPDDIFVLELVALNIAGVWYAYTTGIPFAVAMENVFSDDEMLILSSIIAFWFGTQAFAKKG